MRSLQALKISIIIYYNILKSSTTLNQTPLNGDMGKALFLMFDEKTEQLAKAIGLDVCFPICTITCTFWIIKLTLIELLKSRCSLCSNVLS